MDLRLLLFPVSGMIIGLVAGWAISAILFRPVISRSLLGITYQGYFPSKKPIFSGHIASLVTKEFIEADLLSGIIIKPENFTKLMPVIERHIDDFLRNRLKTAIPMIGMMIGDRTISQLKSVFMNELEIILPGVMADYLKDADSEKVIASAIQEKLLAVPPQKIENALRPSFNKLLCKTGVAIGLITGLVNLAITLILFM